MASELVTQALRLLQTTGGPEPVLPVQPKIDTEPKAKALPVTRPERGYTRRVELRSWAVEERYEDGEVGRLKAEKVWSRSLGVCLWILYDHDFRPEDGLALYFSDELEVLKTKNFRELRQIQTTKLIFQGCRVIQEGAEE